MIVLRLLDWIMWALAIFLIATLAILTCMQVFFRYVVGSALPWPEEVAGYLLVWTSFAGAYIAMRHESHISFDLLVESFPAPLRKLVYVLVDLALMGLFAFMFVFSYRMMDLLGRDRLISIDLPQGLFMIAMIVFAGGAFMHVALRLYRRLMNKPLPVQESEE